MQTWVFWIVILLEPVAMLKSVNDKWYQSGREYRFECMAVRIPVKVTRGVHALKCHSRCEPYTDVLVLASVSVPDPPY